MLEDILNQENDLKKEVTKTQKKAVAAEKRVPVAEKRLKDAQDNLDKINQAVVDTKEENTKAKVYRRKEEVIENRKTTSASIHLIYLTYLDPPPPVDVACATYDAPTQAKCNAVIP